MISPRIVYTLTDEAPALATRSLLPILCKFVKAAGVEIDVVDISLAARILAAFPDYLEKTKQRPDALAILGDLVKSPTANIIKLPNISASIPQLVAAVSELQNQGFSIPNFPESPADAAQISIRKRYDKVLGSAVNPVLREGNSDRRVATPIKKYAQSHPHAMGAWSRDSRTHVAHMDHGDFYGSEVSHVAASDGQVRIEFTNELGAISVMRTIDLHQGDIIDAAVMNRMALRQFYVREMADAREKGLLLSLHLKATMMKISDPVIFGEAVRCYFEIALQRWSKELEDCGFNPNNGIAELLKRIDSLPAGLQESIKSDLAAAEQIGPSLAMVDSARGITNLHNPSDIIIDASMPAMIRSSGQMWGSDGKLHDTKALIPDRCYASVYQEAIRFCKEHGAFDPTTMGSVSNVGLMALQAEEYGSHDTTVIIEQTGTMRVVDAKGTELLKHSVQPGDIWRLCKTKDAAIQNWVSLAIARIEATGDPAIFWLDRQRAHDRCLIRMVLEQLKVHRKHASSVRIMAPEKATRVTCERVAAGLNTIAVTGNILRDYLTDLFPILELGTSAKMLSIVPLLAGGCMFETGAGGTAPKHVQQFIEEGHLRWDSLGEFLAIAVSLEDLAAKTGDNAISVLAKTLNSATESLLNKGQLPSPQAGKLDNRGSHFYLATYWAQALANQKEIDALSEYFQPLAEKLTSNSNAIIHEIQGTQGHPISLGGYFAPNNSLADKAMRPSEIFNQILA